jgi:hypothetical protein
MTNIALNDHHPTRDDAAHRRDANRAATVAGIRSATVRGRYRICVRAIAAAAVAVLAAGCTASTGQGAGHAAESAASPRPDQAAAAALLKIATAFNNEYDRGDYGPVYDRWDARSQAIITKAGYIQRHQECPSAPHATAQVDSATPGPQGAWLVDYEIGGQRLTDYWFYVHHRWLFDLVLSNPGSVSLYRMSPHQYAAAVGCSH